MNQLRNSILTGILFLFSSHHSTAQESILEDRIESLKEELFFLDQQ